ncbi:MAG: hypothetical protein KHX30_01225 [Clostridium sp.]|nr:hypothetical protein [Clostridium sp.]
MIMKMKNKKRKTFELRRIVALLCALLIPMLYIITVMLFIMGNSYGEIFLAISMGASFFLMPVMYMVTKFPKDMAEMYGNFLDMIEKDGRHINRK